MNILAIDTSTKVFSLAVLKDNKIIRERNIKLTKVLSDSIIPGIEDILKKSKISLAHLDGFAVGLGPGSFTSLRVGVSTIKGIAFATRKPVVGISSLDILASYVKPHPDEQIYVLTDARRNLLYTAFYERKDKKLLRKGKYLLIGITDLLKKIKKDTLFVGNGISLYDSEMKKALSNSKLWQGRFALEKDWDPKASELAILAHQRFIKKDFDDPSKLVPQYLYPEDCQVVVREKIPAPPSRGTK